MIPTWTLGDAIRKARTVAGLTAQQLADLVEVDRNTVGNWENNRHVPRPRDLRRVALATDVDLEWLYAAGDLNPEPAGYVLAA